MLNTYRKVVSWVDEGIAKVVSKVASLFKKKEVVEEPVVEVVVKPRRSREEIRKGLIRSMDSTDLLKWSAISEEIQEEIWREQMEELMRYQYEQEKQLVLREWKQNNRAVSEYYKRKTN